MHVGGGVTLEIGTAGNEAVGVVGGAGVVAAIGAGIAANLRVIHLAVHHPEMIGPDTALAVGHRGGTVGVVDQVHPFRPIGMFTEHGPAMIIIAPAGEAVAVLVRDARQCIGEPGILVVIKPLRVVRVIRRRRVGIGNGHQVAADIVTVAVRLSRRIGHRRDAAIGIVLKTQGAARRIGYLVQGQGIIIAAGGEGHLVVQGLHQTVAPDQGQQPAVRRVGLFGVVGGPVFPAGARALAVGQFRQRFHHVRIAGPGSASESVGITLAVGPVDGDFRIGGSDV